MNKAAIYHRANDNYCYCLNENDIKITIRTGYDIENVTLFYNDPFMEGLMGGDHKFKGIELNFTKKIMLKDHLLWSVIVTPPFKRLTYYFVLDSKDESYIYLEDGFYTKEEYEKSNERTQLFYFPWMNKSDINVTPDWVNNTVWYQIFVDRFKNSNHDYNPKNVKPWSKYGKKVSYNDYYGGDLVGIKDKIPYLKDLGITGIYLTPICKAVSNHKYDTEDYLELDPHFGTDEDMTNLVKTAHSNGIKIMMDGVFNHSGAMFKPWLDVVEKGPDSKYFNWFMVNEWPFADKSFIDKKDYKAFFSANATSRKYYTFAFVDPMPKLNTNNPEVIDYIIGVLTKWIQVYDIDGIRLDVANEISHTLCKEMRKKLKELKPDFYILGEIWHDSMPWLRGDEFDSVMNYPFGDSINEFWSNKKTSSLTFEHAINRCYSLYMEQTNKVLFNLLDSHDTIRLITKLKDKDAFYQQMCALFTMPGTVCIYYGTEIVLEGGHDPDCRRCMPWDEIENGKFDKEIAIMKKIISLRKEHKALRNNDYTFSHNDNPRIISYTKHDKSEDIKIVLNCGKTKFNPDMDIVPDNILFSYKFDENILSSGGILIYKL